MSPGIRRINVAEVFLWGKLLGAVAWDEKRGSADFEYAPEFIKQGLNVAPLTMPLRSVIYSFSELKKATYHGLPGLLADALPDRFGNRLIDLWLSTHGRSASDFNPVERLCYMGTRAMGALEFLPALGVKKESAAPIEMPELVALVDQVLHAREGLKVNISTSRKKALQSIIRVGTSAGGNRAKAVLAWNPKTHEIRSGQVKAPVGFEPWILKFDGVNDSSLGDPTGFGRIEYAYYLMAHKAGIRIMPCRLLEEGGRAHFMTKRFDRDEKHEKIHMQSLCSIAHYDFNASGEYGYEQLFQVILKLNLGHDALQEAYRRMLFNVMARNQDDHTRNVAFLMDKAGKWRLSPAFDLVWAYNPSGAWTNRHQMSVNGKRDAFTDKDLDMPAKQFDISKAADIRKEVKGAVSEWRKFARDAGVDKGMVEKIQATHRLI
ncbi:MAG: type II toxin-antitoxin system HipA family toxin [Candidatus Omnitrophica bacterium]|nr:type II toxin-antitoxin system HipA family toxin [Candidatus Omnitrophota bacterium]